MISEETKKINLQVFYTKLENVCGIDKKTVETLHEKYGEKLMNGSFTNINDHGNAYEGSLIEIVLKKLTLYAVRLNELLPDKKRIDKNTLVKVCLLHHIAKAIRLVPNDNQWEIEKRGMVFKYDEDQPSIRTGLHSLLMCQECGVQFTAEEAEAMTVNDRDLTDDQARWHSSVMATIVRQANELTYLDINNKK